MTDTGAAKADHIHAMQAAGMDPTDTELEQGMADSIPSVGVQFGYQRHSADMLAVYKDTEEDREAKIAFIDQQIAQLQAERAACLLDLRAAKAAQAIYFDGAIDHDPNGGE